ncbi:MAG: hypothetical protein AB1626_04310 [Candidatus Micrarchaeota archaeon]
MEALFVEADEKARVCVSKEIVREYGDKFLVVKAPKEILLLPVPKDAVKELQQLGRKAGLAGISAEKIKRLVGEEALKEAGKALGR